MKRIRFDELFLVSAIVIFIGTRKSIAGSILLMLASLNMVGICYTKDCEGDETWQVSRH